MIKFDKKLYPLIKGEKTNDDFLITFFDGSMKCKRRFRLSEILNCYYVENIRSFVIEMCIGTHYKITIKSKKTGYLISDFVVHLIKPIRAEQRKKDYQPYLRKYVFNRYGSSFMY